MCVCENIILYMMIIQSKHTYVLAYTSHTQHNGLHTYVLAYTHTQHNGLHTYVLAHTHQHLSPATHYLAVNRFGGGLQLVEYNQQHAIWYETSHSSDTVNCLCDGRGRLGYVICISWVGDYLKKQLKYIYICI